MRVSLAAVISFVLGLGTGGPAFANPADLDPTFANGGSRTVTFPGVASGATAVALQADLATAGATIAR